MIDFANNMGSPGCDPNSIVNSASSEFCGGVDFFEVWEAFGCMICFVVICLIPFSIFFYEEDATDLNDPTIKKNRWLPALCYESVFLFAFMVLVLPLYFTINVAEIPVQEIVYPINITSTTSYTREVGSSPYAFLDMNFPSSFEDFNQANNATTHHSTLDMNVNFAVYVIGLFSWLGWWLFAIFVGAGLTCAPFDLFVAYIYRPKFLSPEMLASTELELQERTAEIIEITTLMKRERTALAAENSRESKSLLRKRYMNDRIEVNKLTQMVFCVERDVEEFHISKNLRSQYNPLVAPFKLGLGIFFAILSLLWLLQIILAILTEPQATPFLSLYLLSFDSWFPMFGNLTYALFSLYLLFCTIQGCFKMSMRVIFIKIHPMKVGATYLNAFLFNLGVVMMCTLPLINFCVLAFSGYTIDTDVYFLFIVQTNNLRFFNTFFQSKLFPWLILLMACIFLPYLLYRPRDRPPTTEAMRRSLMSRSQPTTGASYSPLRMFEMTNRS